MTIAVNRNLSNCEKARKKGFRGFFAIAFSQLLKMRFTAMVTYSFHLYFRKTGSHHFILYNDCVRQVPREKGEKDRQKCLKPLESSAQLLSLILNGHTTVLFINGSDSKFSTLLYSTINTTTGKGFLMALI